MNIESLVMRSSLLIGLLCLVGAVRAQAPACWPDVQVKSQKVVVATLPKGFNVKRVAFWTCATPTGYRNTWMVFNDADVFPWVQAVAAQTFRVANADAACAAQCDLIYEDNLVAAVRALQKPYLAFATVSLNNGATSRPVRLINADGTLGDAIASTVARVPVGVPCWLNRRVSGSWYSVEGQSNIATLDPADKLSKVAASCTAVLPIGANGAS